MKPAEGNATHARARRAHLSAARGLRACLTLALLALFVLDAAEERAQRRF